MKTFLYYFLSAWVFFIPLESYANVVKAVSNSGGGGGGSPGGSSGKIQINNSGNFGPLSNLVTAMCSSTGSPAFTPAQCASAYGYYDPRWYGASCTGQTVTGITTTASSATITGATFANGSYVASISAGTSNAPTGTVTSGSQGITSVSSLSGITTGDYVYATGVPVGTRVLYVSGSVVYMSVAATSTHAAETVTFVHILNTTLTVSGGVATLGATAGTSLTTAILTYGPADDVGMQAAETAAYNAGGGLVRIPQGMCIPTAPIEVDNNVSFTGSGWGNSIVKPIYSADQVYGVFRGYNDIHNPSPCTLAAAKQYQSNNMFTDFEIDDSLATQATYSVSSKGISIPCNYGSVVDHMYVHDTPATAIASDSGYPASASHNYVVNPGRFGKSEAGSNGIGEGVISTGLDNYSLNDNVVINPTNYCVFVESEATAITSVSHATINNNICIAGPNSGTGNAGTNLRTAGFGNSGALGVVISGNIVDGTNMQSGTDWGGIATDGGTTSLAAGAQTVVTGNHVNNTYFGYDINIYPAAPGTGINADSTFTGNESEGATGYGFAFYPHTTGSQLDTINITGNIAKGSGLCGFGIIGLTGSPTATNIVLTGNIAANNGTTGSTYQQAGFCLSGIAVTGLDMKANKAYDNGTGTQKYAVAVNSTASITQADWQTNDWTGNATGAYDILGTVSGYVWNNKGATFTISGCSATSATGGDTTGSYTSGTSGSCAVTITPNGTSNITAPNGYVCTGTDITTVADASQPQTASTTSSCTLTGTTVSSDAVLMQARPY